MSQSAILKRSVVVLLFLLAVAALAAAVVWLVRMDVVVWLARANAWLADTFIQRLGYLGVFLLMAIESSFIPFPSEVVIPPAGDLARRLPDWSLAGVIFWGTAGSLFGAWVNYGLARHLGRPLLLALIHRHGRLARIAEADYFRAEAFFLRHGVFSTLTGRLIPVIRQIISLPAGLAGMNPLVFSVLTSLGAGIWVTVLALAGYAFGADPDRLSQVLKSESHWLILGVVVISAGYLLIQRRRRILKAAPVEERNP